MRGTYFAATLALLVNLAPSRVAACYGCYGAISAKPVFGASVPADGVLAFAFEGEHPTAAAVSLRRLGGLSVRPSSSRAPSLLSTWARPTR